MPEIPSIHGRRYFCLLFLVGMLLHFSTHPSFSSKLHTTRCNENDRKFIFDVFSECTRLYNYSSIIDCCNWPGIYCSNLTGRIISLELMELVYSINSCFDESPVVLKSTLLSLDDLASLRLDLNDVSLTNGFQSFIRSFPNLRHLYLSSEEDSGMIIAGDIGNLTRLETLELYAVYLYDTAYGETLSMLSRLTSLKRLVLNSVTLTKATDWLHVVSNLPHLEHLDLSGCSLPNVIGHSRLNVNSSKLLAYLDLSYNNLESSPAWSWIFNHSSLVSLIISNNLLTGPIPNSFRDIGDNLFSGEIPRCFGMLNNLAVLSLRNNSISGSIPPELCHASIQILDLSMNNISGVIPQCLCKLQAMTQKKSPPIVMYDSNGTFSTIGAPYKDYISLVLKGYLYNDANHLELVKSLDLSGNSLGGEIPGEISCLTGLISLNFSGNNLTGSVTPKIGSLKTLESLDLSNNHLSGAIPSTIADLNFLGTLSLANNNFSGRIPTGTQIQGFNASAFSGNPWLCGEPLPNKCPGDGDGEGPSINEDHQNPKVNAFDLGLYISVILGFITGFWAFCGALVLKRSWRIAYFRAWIHAYDKLYVVVTLMLVRIRRRYLA